MPTSPPLLPVLGLRTTLVTELNLPSLKVNTAFEFGHIDTIWYLFRVMMNLYSFPDNFHVLQNGSHLIRKLTGGTCFTDWRGLRSVV